MNKTDLVNVLAVQMDMTQSQSRQYLNTFLDVLEKVLKEEESVMLQGFGTFVLWKQAERPGRNPRTGTPCKIPARMSVKFRAGKFLLEALNSRNT